MERTPVIHEGHSDIALSGDIGPGERELMIREAAYNSYVHRGFAHGHDLDDWLAAEAGFEQASIRWQPSETAETTEFELQQSGTLGPWEDEALKRSIKQHPQREISRIEGIEPEEAPPKE